MNNILRMLLTGALSLSVLAACGNDDAETQPEESGMEEINEDEEVA